MFRYSIAILATLLLSACTQHPLDSTGTINFSEEKDFDFSSNIYDIEFTALEESSESVFSAADQVFFYDSMLIVFDGRTLKIQEFNTSGKFLGSIGHCGEGPEEYIFPTGIWVSDTLVYVCDLGQNKTLCFGLRSRQFIENKPFMGFATAKLPNGNFAAFNHASGDEDSHHLSIYDSTGTVIKWKALPAAIESGYINSMTYRLTTFNGDIFVFPPYDNRLFRILPDTCIEYAYFQFGDVQMMPLDMAHEKIKHGLIKESDEYITDWEPIETTDFISVCYQTKSYFYFGACDKKKQESFFWKAHKGEKGPDAFLAPINTHNGKFISILHASYFLENSIVKNYEPFQEFIKANNVSEEAHILMSWRIR